MSGTGALHRSAELLRRALCYAAKRSDGMQRGLSMEIEAFPSGQAAVRRLGCARPGGGWA